MTALFSRFLKNESGATAIEYGLIAGLVSVVIVTALLTVGDNLTTTFDTISSSLGEVGGGGGEAETPPETPPATP